MASYKNGSITLENVYGKKTYETTIVECGSSTELQELTITQNGTYTAPDDVGYSPVSVNVPSKEEETKSITITKNGTTTVLPTSGKVLSKVDIVANVPQIAESGTVSSLLRTKTSASSFFVNSSITDASDYINYDDTENITDMSSMFASCQNLTNVPLFNTSKVTNMSGMFNCHNNGKLVTVPKFDTSKVTSMSYMFAYQNNLVECPDFETSNVTNMSDMFNRCYNLEKAPNFNTSKVTNMSYMFYDCHKIKTIPAYNTSKVTNMSYFLGNYQTKGNLISLPELDTSNVSNFKEFLTYQGKIKNVKLNTSKASDMGDMFSGCDELERIDITRLCSGGASWNYYNSRFCSSCYALKKLIIREMSSIPSIKTDFGLKYCYHFEGTTDVKYNPYGLKDGSIYVQDDKVEELKAATNWALYADLIKPLGSNEYRYDWYFYDELYVNKTNHCVINLFDFEEIPQVSVVSSNENIATITNIKTTNSNIEFDINGITAGNFDITLTINADIAITETKQFKILVPMIYSVEEVEGATYGFILNDDGYYERTNNNKDERNSYSLCKLTFNVTENTSKCLILNCINSSESSDDYGILSNIDTTLSLSTSSDSNSTYKKFQGQYAGNVVKVMLPETTIGEHYIYIKFIRTSFISYPQDTFKFKVIS